MTDKNPTPNQNGKAGGESRGNKIIVLTPDQQREIEEMIVDLDKAARRIDEFLRSR